MEYTFPRGPLLKLLLAHIEGHKLLTQFTGERMVYLFSTKLGKPFKSANFDYFWEKQLMDQVDTKGQDYFAPSLTRTMYIEHITSITGISPEFW